MQLNSDTFLLPSGKALVTLKCATIVFLAGFISCKSYTWTHLIHQPKSLHFIFHHFLQEVEKSAHKHDSMGFTPGVLPRLSYLHVCSRFSFYTCVAGILGTRTFLNPTDSGMMSNCTIKSRYS